MRQFLLGLLVLLGVLALAVPGVAAASPTWLAPVDVSATGQGAFAPQITLDAQGVTYLQLLRIDLATLAVSHVVPAGSAVGIVAWITAGL